MGYSPWGYKESGVTDMTEHSIAAQLVHQTEMCGDSKAVGHRFGCTRHRFSFPEFLFLAYQFPFLPERK